VSISVQSSEPSDVTEVSVIHTMGTEKSSEDTAVEPTETSTNCMQLDTAAAKTESTEKSEELVILMFCLSSKILYGSSMIAVICELLP